MAVAAPAPDDEPRLIAGRYRLIAILGEGGMGVTYRAWDTQAGVPVVLKMPRPGVRNEADVLARFSREIAAMRAVPHESIVPITDSGVHEGTPFVVMRFLPGGSLGDYRRRDESGRPIKNPPGMLHLWLPGVAAALDHIHASGMLHRDVKPANIFLDGFLRPFLGDFGIAKVVDDSGSIPKEQTLTATGMAVGTPEYMAPELFQPKPQVDGTTDQYALAVTVYEMLCGEKPFTGSTAHIVVEHSALPAPPLDAKCPGLPRSLCKAVHRALAKRRQERFHTCGDFAAAVLADLPPLPAEKDTVRLLCPNCRNILKLSPRAAGKSGRCPKCQAAMDVAADLGSLWLESEERGEGTAKTLGGRTVGEAFQEASSATNSRVRGWVNVPWLSADRAAITAALVAGLLLGWLGRGEDREARVALAKVTTDLAKATKTAEDLRIELAALARARVAETGGSPLDKLPHLKNGAASISGLPAPADEIVTNSIGMKLKLIPAGEFMMGDGTGQLDERPAHKVTISKPFLMGIHEVTNAQWKRVMGTIPSEWKDDDRPVETVSWDDAVSFCLNLSAVDAERRTGRVYRLPTEAEWEYACRAGTQTKYSFGDDANLLGDFAWFRNNASQHTHPVAQKKPNAWGLYDMHGNVLEWCADWYGDYGGMPEIDPQGSPAGSFRVYRGGSWYSGAEYCRFAPRGNVTPSYRDNVNGFRVVAYSDGGNAKPAQDETSVPSPSPSANVEPANEAQKRQVEAAKNLGIPVDLTNSIGMKFQLIPAGAFTMGDDTGQSGERPAHEAIISKPFLMGIHEVTNAQWKTVMRTIPSGRKDDDHPVETLSWGEAVSFCRKLSDVDAERRAGRVYRLPTEAEWEYACRAGTKTRYSFGDDANLLGDFSWFADNSGQQTRAVGQKKPNAWGLYDMHGNVWEWCADWYADYSGQREIDPQGPLAGSFRVERGGSWSSSSENCRAALRGLASMSNRATVVGFRVVVSLE